MVSQYRHRTEVTPLFLFPTFFFFHSFRFQLISVALFNLNPRLPPSPFYSHFIFVPLSFYSLFYSYPFPNSFYLFISLLSPPQYPTSSHGIPFRTLEDESVYGKLSVFWTYCTIQFMLYAWNYSYHSHFLTLRTARYNALSSVTILIIIFLGNALVRT